MHEIATSVAIYGVLFVAFRWGFHLRLIDSLLDIRTHDFYSHFLSDGDELVVERYRQNMTSGPLSGSTMLGSSDSGYYVSEFGFWSWALTLLPWALGLSDAAATSTMYSIVAGLNALLATSALIGCRKSLGPGPALLCGLALLQPWSVAISKSIYFCIGLRLLPALVFLIIIRLRRETSRQIFVAMLISYLVVFLSGFIFITTVLFSQLAVIAYYAMVREWKIRSVCMKILTSLYAMITAFTITMGLLFLKLLSYYGSLNQALEKIIETVVKRTGVSGTAVPETFAESLASSPVEILRMYLSMPVFGAVSEGLPTVTSYFRVDALLLLCTIVSLYRFHKHDALSESDRRERGTSLAWIVSTLGPISWFLLARPHSYIHDHLNFALWFLPTIPLGLALLWSPIAAGVKGVKHDPVASLCVAASFIAVALSFVYSLLTVRP